MIATGYCRCGCGEKTPLAPRTSKQKGWVKGQPIFLIKGHVLRGEHNGHWKGGKKINTQGYVEIRDLEHSRSQRNGYVREHIQIAEKAIGRNLPDGAEVHHIDMDPTNNDPSNLVICQDRSYHKLLHQRKRAFDACGHADWRKCKRCKKYDDPRNMTISGKDAFHSKCQTEYSRAWRESKNV